MSRAGSGANSFVSESDVVAALASDGDRPIASENSDSESESESASGGSAEPGPTSALALALDAAVHQDSYVKKRRRGRRGGQKIRLRRLAREAALNLALEDPEEEPDGTTRASASASVSARSLSGRDLAVCAGLQRGLVSGDRRPSQELPGHPGPSRRLNFAARGKHPESESDEESDVPDMSGLRINDRGTDARGSPALPLGAPQMARGLGGGSRARPRTLRGSYISVRSVGSI